MYSNFNTTVAGSVNATADDEDPELTRFRFVVHAVVVPILFAAITVVGLTGNGLVVYVVVTRPRLRTVTNLLLLNLAIADLCFVTVVPPFTAYEFVAGELPRSSWALGDVTCRLLHYLVNVTAYVTVYTLALIAAVRYATVVHGVRTVRWRTRHNVIVAIIGLWLLVMCVNIPILRSYSVQVGENGQDDCNITDMETGKRIFATLFAFAYIIPLSVIGILSALILIHIARAQRSSLLRHAENRQSSTKKITSRRSGRFGGASMSFRDGRDADDGSSCSTRRLSSRNGPSPGGRKRQVTRLLVLIVVLFALLWLPIHVHLMLAFFYGLPESSRFYLALNVLWYFLAYFNSCVNPIIYNHTSKEFRDAFRSVVRCFSRPGRFPSTFGGTTRNIGGTNRAIEMSPTVGALLPHRGEKPLSNGDGVEGCAAETERRRSRAPSLECNEQDDDDDACEMNDDGDDVEGFPTNRRQRRRGKLSALEQLRPILHCPTTGGQLLLPIVVQLQSIDNGEPPDVDM